MVMLLFLLVVLLGPGMPGPGRIRQAGVCGMACRGGIYAARGFPGTGADGQAAGPHMCGPYGSIAFLRALTAHGRGGVKTPPYGMSFTAGL